MPSDLDHHREHHRSSTGAVVDDLPDRVVDVLLEELDLHNVSGCELTNDPVGLVTKLVEQLVRLGEAARDELGRRDLAAVRGCQGRHDDEHAVVGELPPIAKRDVLDVADTQAVDERHPGVDPVDEPCAAARELDDRAVLGDEDALVGNTRVAGELRVRREHPVLAVDRHHVARTEQREHRPQLLLARVPGDVHRARSPRGAPRRRPARAG